ncbi:hypothetical protein ACF0H5_011151 [Mactra antiquata]
MNEHALAFILTQYVALCGAMTQSPNIWPQGLPGPTTDPFFGSWWGNQHNLNFDQFFGAPTDPPSNNVVPPETSSTVPTEPTTTPALEPPTTVMTYDTATPAVPTAPSVPPPAVKTSMEASISLQDLIGLAANGANGAVNSEATNLFLKMLGTATSKDKPAPTKLVQPAKTNETSEGQPENPLPSQKIVSTSPATNVQNDVNAEKSAPTVTSTTPAPPTIKTTTTTTTTTAPTTTTTTLAPTTTAAPQTAPQIVTVPTVKPLVKMTLGEILKLSKLNLPGFSPQKTPKPTTTTTTPKPRGCHYKGHFYEPLAEIERGQTGKWCYGSYCNHKGIVIHWDDHQCASAPPTPPTAQKSQVEPPAVDVSAVAGALTPAEIDALATVPGMKGIADTLRQHGQKSPTQVDISPPSITMPPVNTGMMPRMTFNGAGNGMNIMMGAGMGGMNGMGGAGMSDMSGGLGDPNMIALARIAGIELPSMGGAAGGGEMGSMGGMGGMGGGMGGAGGGNMAELAAMAGLDLGGAAGGGMGGMGGGMGGGSGNMAELAAMAGLDGMSGMGGAGMGGGMGGGMGAGGLGVGGGCFVNGRHYAPGTDIENHRDFGRCYGTYCDFNSKVVSWNDRCRATMSPIAPPQQTMSMRQLQQLDLI